MRLIFILITVFMAGCAQQQYYLKSNLNLVSVGQSKAEILAMFPGQNRLFGGGAPPMQIRAAKRENGKLVEVGEVLMTDGVSPTVAYWFLFEGGELIQWGQPADWQKVSGRYEISYSPAVGATR